jgi:putative transposase
VGGVVVEDDVDHFPRGHLGLYGVEKADELLVPVALHAAADHGALQDIEGGEQGGGAVPNVIVGHVAAAALFQGQSGLSAIECLDLALFVTYESIRQWCLTFGGEFARKLRRCRPKPGDTWHLDEVFLKINGELHYLWRAVDQHGVVLDILVQDRRNATAAKRFFKRLLTGLKYKPKRIVTDGLRSYGVARREILPEMKHRTSRYLNNRAENSHRPTRRRERQMQRFKSPEQAQHFLSSHAMIYGHFRPRRHLMTAVEYCTARAKAFRIWQQETCVEIAA